MYFLVNLLIKLFML